MENNKNLTKWYMNEYILPNCPVNKDPNLFRKSGLHFIIERPKNSKAMEPKRIVHKVRPWNGTPSQSFFGKKKRRS